MMEKTRGMGREVRYGSSLTATATATATDTTLSVPLLLLQSDLDLVLRDHPVAVSVELGERLDERLLCGFLPVRHVAPLRLEG